MNNAEVRAIEVFNGWEAQFRKIHRTEWYPVQVNGVVQLYESEEKAKNAAYAALMKHLFGDGIVRTGERAGSTKDAAEKLFGKVFPGKGRKPFEVVRK